MAWAPGVSTTVPPFRSMPTPSMDSSASLMRTSAMFGTFVSVTGPSISKTDERTASAAFLLPATSTLPFREAPPTILKRSMMHNLPWPTSFACPWQSRCGESTQESSQMGANAKLLAKIFRPRFKLGPGHVILNCRSSHGAMQDEPRKGAQKRERRLERCHHRRASQRGFDGV